MPIIATVLLGVTALLVMISLVPPLAARVNLPTTVVLAACGVMLGAVTRILPIPGGFGPIDDTLNALRATRIDSETFLHIFLPVLLFETAVGVEVRRLLDDLVPILLLAVVAVVVSTFVVGLALWTVAPFGLVPCLLMSAIIATTDPSAVIGIFRDLGAPRRLTMLVEGESLLNDAAALVLFSLFLGMLSGSHEAGLATGIFEFFFEFLGGLGFGYLCGRALCAVVARLHNMPLCETTLTVAFAYLSYIGGHHYLHVSGVVATVTTALVVASIGRTSISPGAWSDLEQVWRQLGFWASSLIFLLAGMLMTPLLFAFTADEVGWLVVVALAALAARAMVLYGLLPVLSRAGLAQPVGYRYKAVLAWGGLRGALSLVLALAVAEEPGIPLEIKRFVADLATGFVLVTLFLNGGTLHALIALLGLDKLTPAERVIRNRTMALALAGMRDSVERMAAAYRITPEVAARTVERYAERLAGVEKALAREPPLAPERKIAIGLAILVNHEEELYLRHFQEGIISRAVVETLTERIGWLLDGVKAHGREGYENEARRVLGFSRQMVWAQKLQRWLGLRAPLAHRLSLRFEALLIHRTVLGELKEFNASRVASLLGAGLAAQLEPLLERRLAMVEQALTALKSRYPGYAPALQHQYLSRAALRLEAADYERLFSESVISEEIHNDLKRDLDRRRKRLERLPRLELGLDLPDLIARVPLFHGLSRERLGDIGRQLRMRVALPDEVLMRRGDRGGSMFFIAEGMIDVRVPGRTTPVHLHSGEFFGEIALITRQPRTADVSAVGFCYLLELEERDFRRLLEADPDLRRHILTVAEERRLLYRPPDRAAPDRSRGCPAPDPSGKDSDGR